MKNLSIDTKFIEINESCVRRVGTAQKSYILLFHHFFYHSSTIPSIEILFCTKKGFKLCIVIQIWKSISLNFISNSFCSSKTMSRRTPTKQRRKEEKLLLLSDHNWLRWEVGSTSQFLSCWCLFNSIQAIGLAKWPQNWEPRFDWVWRVDGSFRRLRSYAIITEKL